MAEIEIGRDKAMVAVMGVMVVAPSGGVAVAPVVEMRVEDVKRISEKHYETLSHRISAFENRKGSGTNKEASD
ncbi:hypothetical protein D1007_18358 [Hordeum vulgare]|nr:hypothetical protein D1007_18358 [Hordeum vulgare]